MPPSVADLRRPLLATLVVAITLAAAGPAAHATLVTYEANGRYAFQPGYSAVFGLSNTGNFQLRFSIDDAVAPLSPCSTYRCEYPGAVLSFDVAITSVAGSLSYGSDSFGASVIVFNDGDGLNHIDLEGGSPVLIPALDGIPTSGFNLFAWEAGFNDPPGPLIGLGLAGAVASMADLSQWHYFGSSVSWREPQTHAGPPWPREARLFATLTSIAAVPEPSRAGLLGAAAVGLVCLRMGPKSRNGLKRHRPRGEPRGR